MPSLISQWNTNAEGVEGTPGSGESRELSGMDVQDEGRLSPSEREWTPAAVTGYFTAVMTVQPEGSDQADQQDSIRTTTETQLVPAKETQAVDGRPAAPRVLIIEDTVELAEVIQATLERMDMVVAHETHGGKAINRLSEVRPDVVLLDIGLPDMTGWKFLETVKQQKHETLPTIIVITAYGDPANRLVGKLQGVHDYLIKPFTSDEVERVVRAALSSKTA